MYLKFICIFTPYISRPEHAGLWYLIYVLQIVPNYISFLQFDVNYLLATPNLKTDSILHREQKMSVDSFTQLTYL